MTSIQMMLSLGALILLSVLLLNVNSNIITTDENMYDSNFGIVATSLGTSVIEEASRKHYDDITDTTSVIKLDWLTKSSDFGTESGEDPTDPRTFDNFDDYHNYSYTDSSLQSAIFSISCKVYYVKESDLNKPISSQYWNKRMDIFVTSSFMQDTIKQSFIYSYFVFR